MKPGHLYFFSYGFPLAFHFREGTGFFAFHFNLRYCAYQDVFLSERFMRELHDPEFIHVLETEFKNASDLSAAFLIKGLLFQKVSKLFPKNKPLFKEDRFENYRELFEYISKHINAKLTISHLAEVSGTTRDLLSKNFSRDIGLPLKKYHSPLPRGTAPSQPRADNPGSRASARLQRRILLLPFLPPPDGARSRTVPEAAARNVQAMSVPVMQTGHAPRLSESE